MGGPDDNSEALTKENLMRRKVDRGRRPDHWIYLDRSWAHRLGVLRTAGTYRIRSRDLARRLAQETLWVDATGTVYVTGRGQRRSAPAAHAAATATATTRRAFPRGPDCVPNGRRHLGR